MVEYIHNHPRLRAHTLFATHYHELTQLSDLLPGVRNYNGAVAEADGQVIFLHKRLSLGVQIVLMGIHVAQLAGLPVPSFSAVKSSRSGNLHPKAVRSTRLCPSN